MIPPGHVLQCKRRFCRHSVCLCLGGQQAARAEVSIPPNALRTKESAFYTQAHTERLSNESDVTSSTSARDKMAWPPEAKNPLIGKDPVAGKD